MKSPKRIVLIIGAGASHDLHNQFALGTELLQQISDRVTDRTSSETSNLSSLLEKLGYNLDLRNDFVECLDTYKNTSVYPSIDGFIDEVSSYPEYEAKRDQFNQIAKFSIMFHILGYEGEIKNSSRNGLKTDAWLHEVAKFIDEKKIHEKRSEIELKIVTFNYDRNIEHFLYNHDRFTNCREDIKSYIKESINHVYGKIGNLDWENTQDFFEFGEQNDKANKIYEGKNAIDLMYMERIKNNIDENQAAQWIHDLGKTRIVAAFGFSFDLINYRLLALQNLETIQNEIKVIANIYPSLGDEFKSRREMANKIRTVKHNVELTYLSCTEFLKEVFTRELLNQ